MTDSERDPLLDPRSYAYVNARRAAEQAERDLFAEVEPKPRPGIVGMVIRALRDDPAADRG